MTPTAMPAFAPVERPVFGLGAGVGEAVAGGVEVDEELLAVLVAEVFSDGVLDDVVVLAAKSSAESLLWYLTWMECALTP